MPARALPCTLLSPLPAQVLQQLRTTFSNGFGLPPYQSAAQQEAEVEAAWQAAKAAEAAAKQQAEAEEAAKQALLAKYLPYQVGGTARLPLPRVSVCLCGSAGLTGVDQHPVALTQLAWPLTFPCYKVCCAVLPPLLLPRRPTPRSTWSSRGERGRWRRTAAPSSKHSGCRWALRWAAVLTGGRQQQK